MIGRSGERGSGISVLAAHDDDDDDIYNYNDTLAVNGLMYAFLTALVLIQPAFVSD